MSGIISRFENASCILQGWGLVRGSGSDGYWNNINFTEPVLKTSDGCQIEGYIRWPQNSWRSEDEWLDDLRFHQYLVETGKWAICMTKYTNLSQLDADRLVLYGLTSFLLYQNGAPSYFAVYPYSDSFREILNMRVGVPLEGCHKRSDANVYEREYSDSLVLVNPSNSTAVVYLDRFYLDMSGSSVSAKTLEGHTGVILRK
jgi:hypothetical protein